ncbi:uncharacterized protein LOC134833455 [Culicoides brevitarsis]|uniref:uncharacterized protein LOC134833455 n=1 Tax=Culicoides brevitarsis TaxID=469753 RepID=UPI00307BE339
MDANTGKQPFDMSLDEIIALKNDTDGYVLDLNTEEDIEMNDDDFKAPSSAPSVSMMSYGRTKDPELSVNIRLRPENLVERPKCMPPLLSREAQKQMDELEELKSENRLLELNNLNKSRSSLNSTIGRSSVRSNFHRTFNRSINNPPKNQRGKRDLRQILLQTVEKSNAIQQNTTKSIANVDILLQNQTISKYVDVINMNFGAKKYDMNIQKEIAALQKKPFMYACGSSKVITQDGEGIEGPKVMALGTKSTINCRFSKL